MDLIHNMHYSACAIWAEPIKRLVLSKINRIIPTYLAYVRYPILP